MKSEINTMVYDVEQILTIRELEESACARFSDRVAFIKYVGDELCEITFSRCYEEVKALATYLRRLVPAGSRVAVCGKNSYEWAISYLAVTCGVGVVVPIDKDLRGEEIASLLADSESSVLLCAPEILSKLGEYDGPCRLLSFADIDDYIREGQALLEEGDTAYRDHEIDPHALGILLYTSGTTGVAKGVMLSQYNICFDIVAILRRLAVYPTDRAFSVSPLHHTYECTAGFLLVHYCGASIFHNTSLRKLQAEMKMFRPTIMAVVPLIMDTFRNTIIKKYNRMFGGKALLSLQRFFSERSLPVVRKRIFSVVNEVFGGQLRLLVCGAASLDPEVFRDFERFGIRVVVGYGLTETSPVSIMHNDFYQDPTDIGYPLSGVKIRLSDVNDEGIGEIAIKGPNVMLGYYKNEEATEAVLRDGWFYTGDLGVEAPNGAYKIVGRSKSMIVSPGGKKIFPEELELFLSKSLLVKECMVFKHGEDDKGVLVASFYPDAEEVRRELSREGLSEDSEAYREAEQKLFEAIVAEVNEKFPHYKRISCTVVRHREFVKTTTKKIRRQDPDNLTMEG